VAQALGYAVIDAGYLAKTPRRVIDPPAQRVLKGTLSTGLWPLNGRPIMSSHLI
jgi:hypothetical protein